MRRGMLAPALFAVAAVCLVCSGAVTSGPAQEETEPPTQYLLKIGDKQVLLTENETITVEGEFSNPEVRLEPAPHRRFAFAGIKFNYPRHFSFKSEHEEGVCKTWTLNGNDCVITVFAVATSFSVEDYVAGVKAELGDPKCEVSPLSTPFGETTLKGLRMDATVVGSKIRQDSYSIPTKEGARMLVVQDSLTDKGEPTKEAADTLKMLAESFVVSKE